MTEIYELNDELIILKNKIEENLAELSTYLNMAYQYGAFVGTNWEVVMTSVNIPLDIVQKVDILGHKSEDLIEERETKFKELLTLREKKCQELIDKAKEFNIPDWYIEKLKKTYSMECQYNIIKPLENLKKEIDTITILKSKI